MISSKSLIGLAAPTNYVGEIALIKAILPSEGVEIKAMNKGTIGGDEFKPFCLLVRAGSIFSSAVLHIFSLRPKKKMTRSNALRIVAVVTNIKRFVKVTIGQHVGYAVGIFALSSIFAPKMGTSVAGVADFSANPEPAVFGFSNLIPKSFLKRFHLHEKILINKFKHTSKLYA